MRVLRAKTQKIMGWHIAPPHLTLGAYLLGFWYLALPFLAIMAALDTVFYLFFSEVLDTCYGVLCFFEEQDISNT